ncbi:MAG: DUF72 domain-containing protein [Chthoniobacter sp.]
MKLWIGTSGFQYPEWKGKFYPEKMPASKMLPFYGEHFSSTEINYTFRRIPAAGTILKWSSLTPAQFRFSFKAPQRVTHFAKLRGCAELLGVFAQAIAVAEEKCGPVLFQLPPTFDKDVDVLRAFLADIPQGMRAAFEFRHPSWFDEAVFETLRAAQAALCIAENEELATPAVATADFGYLRLRREDYTSAGIQKWADHLGRQRSRWSEAFVYFKHEERAVGPAFAQELQAFVSRSG